MANLSLWALLWFTLAVDSFLTPPFCQHHHDKKRVAHCSFSVRSGFPESLFTTNTPPFLQWHNQGSSRSKEELLALVDDWLLRSKSAQTDDRQKIRIEVNARYQEDCQTTTSTLLAVEESNTTTAPFHTIIPFQWITTSGHDEKEVRYPLAVQSMVPVLNLTSVAHLRAAADSFWHKQEGKTTSRFTYQRPGNYELHVSDLPPESKSIVNECLIQSIYPLIRNVFWNGDSNNGGSSNNNLCVYDALIIRYNATKAAAAAKWTSTKTITTTTGAGQPFHRDFGIVSINIMLNSDDEFLGGGTFFENQLLPSYVANDTTVRPLKPRGVGHLLAHYSAERHAGSVTMEGVRDILVLFVTAQQSPPPRLIQCALLKQARRWDNQNSCDTEMEARAFRIIQHQRLALDAVPNDGEAWQYLGTALMEYSNHHPASADSVDMVELAKDCLFHAAALTPCDSRVYNNLALALQRLLPPPGALCIEHAYEQAWDILDRSNKAGCDVEQEWDALSLNYGLYLSNQDLFQDACRVLYNTAMKKETKDGRIVEDAHRLYEFCKKKIQAY